MRAAYLTSRSAGVTHWAATSLTATDDAADASIVDRILLKRHGRSALTEIFGHCAPPEDYVPRRSLFDGVQKLRAIGGDVATLSLPRSLNFHLLCGARVAGDAYFDRTIREFLVPIIFDLDDYAASPFGRRYRDGSKREAARPTL